MLKARISIEDLSRTPRWCGRGIRFGGSEISAFPNPCLCTLFAQGINRWVYAVLERSTHEPDEKPPSAQGILSLEDYAEVHKEILNWPLDYALVEAVSNGPNAQVRVTTGRLGVAPLYAAVGAGHVELSWDCADVISRGSHAADFEVLAHVLGLRTFYTSRQVCTGIALLTERSSLLVDAEGASFVYPSAAPTLSPHALQEGVDVLGAFEACMASATGARPLDASGCLVELSGGMDSASVAVATTQLSGAPWRSAGIVLAQPDRNVQSTRRRSIVQTLALEDVSLDMSAYMPVVDLDSSVRAPEHPLGEFYIEAFDALWRQAATKGCHAVLTGIGGDELFPRYETDHPSASRVKPSKLIAAEKIARSMLSRRARVAVATEPLYCAPTSAIPQTALLAHTARSPYMMRLGLWPVNPLCDPSLIGFCHRLPVKFRGERRLLRQYLRKHLRKDLFPIGYKKETFDYVLPEAISLHYDQINAQLRECALADFGLVDMKAVKCVLKRVADTRDIAATAPLAIFLFLERFMRQVT
ncbi:asparagine synthase-related protein [Cupriavidus alkaliphilus]|uniref:asparagine synthase-related protein n=1 Tax=Cupriavidus alkaliphilus TaxID=942866 RepID=UPI000DC2DFCE|nr:asparagine synthase-related protein [Cupriavidus alkaliphilus]RAS01801.1 asparagine synthase (glutamine-hydrolysing) [Cupriavidus alkaliphilus]